MAEGCVDVGYRELFVGLDEQPIHSRQPLDLHDIALQLELDVRLLRD